MIRRLFSSPRPLVRQRRCVGFTLIELLTVIAIILVLAGLLLNVAGNANYKSSFARAKTEVKAMETALESYKADNGTYPRAQPSSPTTQPPDLLNAQSNTDPGGTNKALYQAASETLFQTLSGITSFNGNTPVYSGKRYMEFKPSQLAETSGATYTTPLPTTTIVDPFGLCYGYSTINIWAVEQNKTDTSTYGYNPTFDLWSSGGYGSGGKTYPKDSTTGVTATGTACAAYWAKNW